MADGLIIKHPTTGAVIFDTNTITAHSRAAFNTSTSPGSVSVASMLRGSPLIIQALPNDDGLSYNTPEFEINGSTISWNLSSRSMRVLAASRAIGGAGAASSFDGLFIRRPSGALQISSADLSLQLSTFGALTLTDDGQSHPQPIVTGSITVTGNNPVIAVRGQNGKDINLSRISSSGNNYTFAFSCDSSNPVGLIYWVFDTTSMALSIGGDVGLVLKDGATGVKTFDSRCWTMNMVDYVVSQPGDESTRGASGRTYAAIQSTPSYLNVMEDLGSYSNSVSKPGVVEAGPPQNPRPPGTTWAYMQLYSQRSFIRSEADGSVTVGMSEFETFTDWYPASTVPVYNKYGTTRHSIIDVTGLPSATMPNPGELTISVSASVREVTVSSATNAVTVSPPVTVTASGGTAPYQYLWSRRIGGGGVGPYGPTNTNTFQTETSNQPPGSTWVETWGCRVIDAQGRTGYSPDVVFRHIVIAIDLSPDAISYSNVSTVTNDPVGFAGVPAKQITGISQQITLRIERFNYSGNADVGYLLCFKGPTANGPWTQVANINPTGTATRYVDFIINNGEWFYFYGQAETTSGRKTSTFDVTLWNESTGHNFFASVKLSMVVDDNNDFNVADYNLDPVNFTNLSFYTNSESGGSGGTFGQFTGINRDISVRVAISGRSGSMSSATLGAHSNPTAGPYGSGGPWENYSLNALANSSRDFVVRNGQWMYFDAGGYTTSGRKDHSYTVTLTNMTTGQVIDTFTVSGTVDADNNYNVADYDLDGIDWANIFINQGSNSWYQEHGHKTMSGINQNITMSMQLANVTYSGGAFRDTAMYAVSNSRGVLAQQNMANGTSYFTVQPNEQIKFGFNVATTGGQRQFGFDVFVYNQTTGAFVDHFYVSGYIGS